MGTFVRSLAPVLSGRTNGYGLWVYRNYVNNAVYNSQFALDQEGWSFSGDSRIEERNGSKAAVIRKKGSISQDLDGRIPESVGSMWNFTQKQKTAEPARRSAWAVTSRRSMWARGKRTGWNLHVPFRDPRFPSPQNGGSMWTISGSTPMSRIDGLSADGSTGDLAGDFRTLNRELTAGSVPQEEWRPERRMRADRRRGNDGRRSVVCRPDRRWKRNGADRRDKGLGTWDGGGVFHG